MAIYNIVHQITAIYKCHPIFVSFMMLIIIARLLATNYAMPTVLATLNILNSLSSKITPLSAYFNPPFLDKKTKIQEDEMSFPKSHS